MSFNNKGNHSDCPCLGCTDRHVGCHSECERYKPWKEKATERNKARRQEAINADTMSDSKKRQLWRNKRYCYKNRKTVPTKNV